MERGWGCTEECSSTIIKDKGKYKGSGTQDKDKDREQGTPISHNINSFSSFPDRAGAGSSSSSSSKVVTKSIMSVHADSVVAM